MCVLCLLSDFNVTRKRVLILRGMRPAQKNFCVKVPILGFCSVCRKRIRDPRRYYSSAQNFLFSLASSFPLINYAYYFFLLPFRTRFQNSHGTQLLATFSGNLVWFYVKHRQQANVYIPVCPSALYDCIPSSCEFNGVFQHFARLFPSQWYDAKLYESRWGWYICVRDSETLPGILQLSPQLDSQLSRCNSVHILRGWQILVRACKRTRRQSQSKILKTSVS